MWNDQDYFRRGAGLDSCFAVRDGGRHFHIVVNWLCACLSFWAICQWRRRKTQMNTEVVSGHVMIYATKGRDSNLLWEMVVYRLVKLDLLLQVLLHDPVVVIDTIAMEVVHLSCGVKTGGGKVTTWVGYHVTLNSAAHMFPCLLYLVMHKTWCSLVWPWWLCLEEWFCRRSPACRLPSPCLWQPEAIKTTKSVVTSQRQHSLTHSHQMRCFGILGFRGPNIDVLFI